MGDIITHAFILCLRLRKLIDPNGKNTTKKTFFFIETFLIFFYLF